MQTVEQEPCQNRKITAVQWLVGVGPVSVAATWCDPRRKLANAANRVVRLRELPAAAWFMLDPVTGERAI
jgi:hypothetical protein